MAKHRWLPKQTRRQPAGKKGFSNFNIFFTKISNVKIQLKIMKMK
jgi:hypothetical protein